MVAQFDGAKWSDAVWFSLAFGLSRVGIRPRSAEAPLLALAPG
jgi:hypothetical protein